VDEVRWELDLRGFEHVKLIVSGGIDEDDIANLNPHCDGYGIGTAIANAKTIDFALDIIEIDGEPFCKRGKMSGRKQVLRCDTCFGSTIVPHDYDHQLLACRCSGVRTELLKPALESGKRLHPPKSLTEVREYVRSEVGKCGMV
jgi:nicotinate phosphoribosyltransferase